MKYAPVNPLAAAAVKAAQNRRVWGRNAATGYALKRGVHPSLLRLAYHLEVMKRGIYVE